MPKKTKHKERTPNQPTSETQNHNLVALTREKGWLRRAGNWCIDTLFTSVYDTITWVAIGLTIGAIFYYRSGGNFERLRWAFIALGIETLIMLILRVAQDRRKRSKETPRDPFEVILYNMMGSEQRSLGGVFTYRAQTRGADVICPVHRMAHLRITNRQTVKSQIETYTVEALSDDERWVKLTRVRGNSGGIYWCDSTFTQCQAMDHASSLDTALSNRIKRPDETVDGWVFFELPEDVLLDTKYRIYIKDFGGAEIVKTLRVERPGGDFAQSAEMTMSQGVSNLTGLEPKHYSDVYPQNRE